MDFLNLMYRRWIYFSTDPEVLATFFNNRFLLILLVIVLIFMPNGIMGKRVHDKI